MKDIIISRRRQLTELLIFCFCLVIAFALNIWAIISYNAPWIELYSSFFYMLIFAIVIYALTVALRLCIFAIRGIFRLQAKKQSKS